MSAVSLRGICVASVFFGVVLTLLPDGRERRVASMCATTALLIMFLSLVRSVNWGEYTLSLSQTRNAAALITTDAEQRRSRMNRLVIEKECEEYIMDKAGDYGLELEAVRVTAVWRREGVWVPDTVSVIMKQDSGARSRLASWIETQLGIRADRQEWSIEGAAG